MKTIKLIRKVFLFGLIGLSLLFWISAFSIWIWPSILINTHNLERLAQLLHRYDIHVTWKRADLSAHSESFLKKQITIEAEDLCISAKAYRADTCFEKVHLPIEFKIENWTYRLKIGETDLNGGKVILNSPPPNEQNTASTPSQSLIPKVPAFFKKLEVTQFHLQIKDFQYQTADTSVHATIELKGTGSASKSHWDLNISGRFKNQTEEINSSLLFFADSLNSQWYGPYQGSGKLEASLPKQQTIEANLTLSSSSNERVSFLTGITYRDHDTRMPAQIRGELALQEIALEVNSPSLRMGRDLPVLRVSHCKTKIHQKEIPCE